jgi:hypothetical protein
MKTIKTVVALALLALAGSGFSAQKGLSPSIKAYYAKNDALTIKKDLKGVQKLYADTYTADFVSLGNPNKSGKVTTRSRAQEIATVAQAIPFIDKFAKFETRIDHVTLGTGTATIKTTSRVLMQTVADPSGKKHEISGSSTSEDLWVLVGGVWKMKSSKTITEDMKMDGQAIPSH